MRKPIVTVHEVYSAMSDRPGGISADIWAPLKKLPVQKQAAAGSQDGDTVHAAAGPDRS